MRFWVCVSQIELRFVLTAVRTAFILAAYRNAVLIRFRTSNCGPFEAYRQLSQVSIRPMTAISSMANIHEDICATAKRKEAAVIILPFHKHQIGIFVDRGLGGTSHVSASNVSYRVAVLFFGGGDDREALAYGGRMAEHQIDEQFLDELKVKTTNDDSINYEERIVKNVAETVAIIREVNSSSLFLVGSRPVSEVACSLKSSEFPELGPVGGLLVSQDYPTTASVLVIQQYNNDGAPINLVEEREEE
ncbi:hypothetical protein LR48_Vigan01g308300 [Vigna angularis]|uniref:Uncharacterized protein n=1 Tax=Phaseolus angularis TaxID=3914 RepID=A0A0L9TSZ8_PHAAN|nr:hypothetical protein LR48_Vigan01g308300 [Vigna angularis]